MRFLLSKFKQIFISTFILISFSTNAISENYKLKQIAFLAKPWGFSFINEAELIITEKIGNIKIVNINNGKVKKIKHNLNYINVGQGGLLDINYKNGTVWVSYVEKLTFRKIYRFSIAKGKLNNERIIFENIFQSLPKNWSEHHFGGRLLIKDEYLFASLGEQGKKKLAQDPNSHLGSIIRIKLNGEIPIDNPKFINKPDWLPELYQIGFRNPQGLTASPFDNKIYASNHGPKGGDWFGEVKKGENYGWPILGWGGVNYDDTYIGPKWKSGFTKPIKYWVPSIGVSSITIYEGNEFNEWNGHALVTSLSSGALRKINLDPLSKNSEKIIFENKINRIRDILVDKKDGKIFFLTEKYYGQDGPIEDGLWKMERN
jgi:aldose sugar dehydrogenase